MMRRFYLRQSAAVISAVQHGAIILEPRFSQTTSASPSSPAKVRASPRPAAASSAVSSESRGVSKKATTKKSSVKSSSASRGPPSGIPAAQQDANGASADDVDFAFSTSVDDLFSFTSETTTTDAAPTAPIITDARAKAVRDTEASDGVLTDAARIAKDESSQVTETTADTTGNLYGSTRAPLTENSWAGSTASLVQDGAGLLSGEGFTPSLDGAADLSGRGLSAFPTGIAGFGEDGSDDGFTSAAPASLASPLAASPEQLEAVLSSIDMLCDDLYHCKNDVLRSFARTRHIAGRTKAEVVLRLIEMAHKDAHGESRDLSVTKRLLGDVFGEEVRTSGVRTAWTNKSLEASHVEMACDRHLKFEAMVNTQKTLMLRRNGGEASRLVRRLTRPLRDDFDALCEMTTGGINLEYVQKVRKMFGKERSMGDKLVRGALGAFASYLVSYIRYGSSANLLTRTNVNEKLTHLSVVRPATEDVDQQLHRELMAMLDGVVDAVHRRRKAFGGKKLSWGQETAEVLVAEAQAFSEESHDAWDGAMAPAWVHDLAGMFNNWETIVRTDLPTFTDVPRFFFDCILNGVVAYDVMAKIYKDIVTPFDIPISVRVSLRRALEAHFKDEEKAANAMQELLAYVHAGEEVRGGVRGTFFISVLSQIQGATPHGSEHTLLHKERVAVIMKEVGATASRCTRSFNLQLLLVKLTEDLHFHLVFDQYYSKLNASSRHMIRNAKNINMVETLVSLQEKDSEEPMLDVKQAGFLAIQLLFLCLRSAEEGRRPILERYVSTLGRHELDLVGLTESEAVQVRDLRVAFPPQLSYNSWLDESDTKGKSIYKVLPSVAVKGSTNQAMIISQAPMMKALDAISRVPWRINKYMLHVQEAIVQEGFGFGKILPAFYPLHYTNLPSGEVQFEERHTPGRRLMTPSALPATTNDNNPRGSEEVEAETNDRESDDNFLEEDEEDETLPVSNVPQVAAYRKQLQADWKELSELRSSRIHYLQALRQARSIVQFSHIYFPNSMDFRGRMYPLPGRLNHTGSDPFRALLEYAEPKPLGKVGLYWLKVHLANKMGMSKLSFDERVHYVDEHIEDVVNSAESPLHGDRWWREASEPLQCLMACKELTDALKCSQGAEHFLSRLPVAVDGSYNGLQHYSAMGRDAHGGALVNLLPSERPADAYTGILKEMMGMIEEDARKGMVVAQRCIGSGRGQDTNHIKRKTIKRPIMTQVYGVTQYGMTEQILDELVKQNKSHALWTFSDMREMARYICEMVLRSLGVTFAETQKCRDWLERASTEVWESQPADLRNAFCWTTPLGLVVRQPYRERKEVEVFTAHGITRVPGHAVSPASRKQLSALAPNLIHSLDATHLAMTALEMQARGLSMMAVHDSYWTYACDLPEMSKILREQFVALYESYDPLWELKSQWEEQYFFDLRRKGVTLPDPPQRGTLNLKHVLESPYFFS